jgi:hypothetical protein
MGNDPMEAPDSDDLGEVRVCEHESFEADVAVNRHTEVDDGPVIAYSVDLTVRCAVCLAPFCFRGPAVGVSQMEPMVSLDGTELRAPIHPMSDPTTGIGLLGFHLRIHDDEKVADDD